MKRQQTKKPVNYCLWLIERMSRDEKKELMGRIEMSILYAHDRRVRVLRKQGLNPADVFTPEEEAVYLIDTIDLDWPHTHEIPS